MNWNQEYNFVAANKITDFPCKDQISIQLLYLSYFNESFKSHSSIIMGYLYYSQIRNDFVTLALKHL